MRKFWALIGFSLLLCGCGGDDATDVKVIVEQKKYGDSMGENHPSCYRRLFF